jgi:transcriptional regulator with XRE-family HTH domain
MSKDVRKLVGQNVKRLREAMKPHLSQAALATKLGVDRAYISSIERGVQNATIVSLWLVSQALDVHISELFEDDRRRK